MSMLLSAHFRSDVVAAELEKIKRFNCILQQLIFLVKFSKWRRFIVLHQLLFRLHVLPLYIYIYNTEERLCVLFNILCPVLLDNSYLLRSEKKCAQLEDSSAEEMTHEPVNESCIAEALQRTSKAIQDIDALISAATLTWKSPSYEKSLSLTSKICSHFTACMCRDSDKDVCLCWFSIWFGFMNYESLKVRLLTAKCANTGMKIYPMLKTYIQKMFSQSLILLHSPFLLEIRTCNDTKWL